MPHFRDDPIDPNAPPLRDDEVAAALADLPRWTHEGGALVRRLRLRGFSEALAFVNAAAWVAHRLDHHPDLILRYRDVEVRFWTHTVGGVTHNDLVGAAQVEALLPPWADV